MDIEKLTKSQIILLTLLVSFVTSIATGIVTVSLMDQAPPIVAQTVNRVIEHTVETVVPTTGQAATSIVTQQKTVVVNEADLIAQAVQKVSPSIVKLYSRDPDAPQFLGLALVLDSSGRLAADTAALGESADANVALPDGTLVRAFVRSRDAKDGFALLQAATSTGGKPIAWKPADISLSSPTLGESVVALSGKTIARISNGIVTAVIPGNESADVVDTNVSQDSIMSGSPLVTTDGTVLGVSTEVSRASSQSGFISAGVLVAKPTEAPAKK